MPFLISNNIIRTDLFVTHLIKLNFKFDILEIYA